MPDRDTKWSRMMCAVCHHRLNAREDPLTGELTAYVHGTAMVGHDPRPVPEVSDDTILVCDFCLRPHPVWDMPAKQMPGVLMPSEQAVMVSVSDWAACDPCKRLVEADDYEGLTQRAVEGHLIADPDMAETMKAAPALLVLGRINIRNQMEAFREARDGDPIPIEQAAWVASRLREVTGE